MKLPLVLAVVLLFAVVMPSAESRPTKARGGRKTRDASPDKEQPGLLQRVARDMHHGRRAARETVPECPSFDCAKLLKLKEALTALIEELNCEAARSTDPPDAEPSGIDVLSSSFSDSYTPVIDVTTDSWGSSIILDLGMVNSNYDWQSTY